MTDDRVAELSRRLAGLRADFQRRLPARLEEVTSAARAAQAAGLREAERIVALRAAHTLAGTAGAYGHRRLAACLREVEELLSAADDDIAATLVGLGASLVRLDDLASQVAAAVDRHAALAREV